MKNLLGIFFVPLAIGLSTSAWAVSDFVSAGDFASAQAAADTAAGKVFFVPAGQTVTVQVPTPVAPAAPDIQTTLNNISRWRMGDGAFINVVVPCGTYNNVTKGISVTHAQGKQLSLVAGCSASIYNLASSAVTILNTGAASHALTITLVDASTLGVGDYLRITGAAGTGEYRAAQGLWRITAKSGNAVTLSVPDHRAAINAMTLTAATLQRPPVTLKFAPNTMGAEFYALSIGPNGSLGNLTGFAFVGDKTTAGSNGIGVLDQSYLQTGDGRTAFGVAVADWARHGIWVFRNAQATATGIIASNNTFSGGYAVFGGQLDVTSGTFSANSNGVAATDHGQVNSCGSNFNGNDIGTYANDSSNILSCNSTAYYNVTGFYTFLSSFSYLQGATAAANIGFGVQTETASQAYVNGMNSGSPPANGADLYSPAKDTIGPSLALNYSGPGAATAFSPLIASQIQFAGAAPGVAACGTSPSLSASAKDWSGTITSGTGATTCRLNFSVGHAGPLDCNVSSYGAAATYAVDVNGISLAGVTASTKYSYFCR
jgi:hypothetical protein